MVEGPLHWGLFSLAILFALGMQITANLANDYFDFLNGADGPTRKGPGRAAQMGWIPLPSLRFGAILTLTLSLAIGLFLALYVGLWSMPIVAAAGLAAWYYTAGKKPLGYLGFGELLVFPFFGPVAVVGSYYLQTFEAPLHVWIASIPPALLSCAILAANNLRDRESDAAVGKRTLVVRYGLTFGRWEYALLILFSALIPVAIGVYATLWLIPVALPCFHIAFRKREHAPLLPGTALLLLIYTLLFLR
jgi:1,4-dihydroxy-2-naphthoate octaprenyltransferase